MSPRKAKKKAIEHQELGYGAVSFFDLSLTQRVAELPITEHGTVG